MSSDIEIPAEIVSYEHIDKTFRYAVLATFAPLGLAGFFGNMIILYAIGYKKQTKFGSDAAICTMAVCDATYLVVIIFNDNIVVPKDYKHSAIGCKLIVPFLSILSQVNLWLKVYVSYTRMR